MVEVLQTAGIRRPDQPLNQCRFSTARLADDDASTKSPANHIGNIHFGFASRRGASRIHSAKGRFWKAAARQCCQLHIDFIKGASPLAWYPAGQRIPGFITDYGPSPTLQDLHALLPNFDRSLLAPKIAIVFMRPSSKRRQKPTPSQAKSKLRRWELLRPTF